jgi:phytoene dehydrogenase-like protein
MFAFVFRMLSAGDTCVPADGMGAIPQQLAAALPQETVHLHTPVRAVTPGRVLLVSGDERRAKAVVVATAGPEAARLLGDTVQPGSRSVTCLYFAATRSPLSEPILVLNGEPHGLVNNVAVMSDVAPSYAPAGAALVSVTVLGIPEQNDAQLEAPIRGQLSDWLGAAVQAWRLLRLYRIPQAQPEQTPPALTLPERPVWVGDGLFVCGDHRDNASINGAMVSERRAAEAVLHGLGLPREPLSASA